MWRNTNKAILIFIHMRSLLLCLLLLCLLGNNTHGQAAARCTDVTIIGLNHDGNKLYNADTLTNVLLRIQPEVILFESDSVRGYFTRLGVFKQQLSVWFRLGRKLRIFGPPAVEYTATSTYLKGQPTTMVHPFDKTITHSRRYVRQMSKLDLGLWKALYYAHINNEMSERQNELYHHWTFFDRFLDRSLNFPLWRMNNDTTTQLLREKELFEYTYFKQFTDSIPSIQKYAPAMAADQQEWTERNQIMAANILKFLALYPGKRLVVLTGNKHRHLLINLLSSHKETRHFRLLDLYGGEIMTADGQGRVSFSN